MPTTDTSASRGNGGIDKTIEHASNSLHHTIDKLSEAARPAAEKVASTAHSALDKISHVASDASDRLGSTAEHLNELQERAMENMRGTVRARPLVALGVAVAFGFVLSRFLNGR